eukprot:365784-Chlamydomonas_euryale.AAC.2
MRFAKASQHLAKMRRGGWPALVYMPCSRKRYVSFFDRVQNVLGMIFTPEEGVWRAGCSYIVAPAAKPATAWTGRTEWCSIPENKEKRPSIIPEALSMNSFFPFCQHDKGQGRSNCIQQNQQRGSVAGDIRKNDLLCPDHMESHGVSHHSHMDHMESRALPYDQQARHPGMCAGRLNPRVIGHNTS